MSAIPSTEDLWQFEAMAAQLEAPTPDEPNPYSAVIKDSAQMRTAYAERIVKSQGLRLDLSRWFHSFRVAVRPLIPGDFMVLLADTGQGKTAVLQNIGLHAAPLPTMFFEIELSEDLMHERMAALVLGFSQEKVESMMRANTLPDISKDLAHLSFCFESMVSVDDIRKVVKAYNESHSEPLRVVIVDYIQLLASKGNSRYDRISNLAENLKILAKELDVVMIAASQVHRPDNFDGVLKPGLHSSKDSGSIENSAGLLVGVYRENETDLKLEILKNTRGRAGVTMEGMFDGPTMRVWDRLHHYAQKTQPQKFL